MGGGLMETGGRPEAVYEEATLTAPEPAEPHGPRRCGGPGHPAGLSKRRAAGLATVFRPAGMGPDAAGG